MFCARCRSPGLKQSHGSLICRECGYEKKGIQVLEEENEYIQGVSGKHLRKVNYVTEKKHTAHDAVEKLDVDLLSMPASERLLTYLRWYQGTMFKAAASFSEQTNYEGNLQQGVKDLWSSFMRKWFKLNIPLRTMFTNNQQQEWDPQRPDLSDHEASSDEEENAPEQQEEFNRPMELEPDDRAYTSSEQDEDGMAAQVYYDATKVPNLEPVISEELQSCASKILKQPVKQAQESAPLLTPKKTLQLLINKLDPTNLKKFFSKLASIEEWPLTNFALAARTYTKAIFAYENPTVKLRYARLTKQQLRSMVTKRGFAGIATKVRCINKAVFCYDLLLHTYSQSVVTEPKPTFKELVALSNYKSEKKPLVRRALSCSLQLLAGEPLRKKSPVQIPFVNYNFIYSLLHVACLMQRQPYYVSEIIDFTPIVIEKESWVHPKFLVLSQRPSCSRVRRESIRLCRFIEFNPPTIAYRWIDKILSQFRLESLTRRVRNLYTLLVKDQEGWTLCREDVHAMAALLIYFKLTIGLDNQPHLATIDVQDIRQQFDVGNDLNAVKVARLRRKMDQMPIIREITLLRFKDIVAKINEANDNRKRPVQLRTMNDIDHLNKQELLTIIGQFQEESRSINEASDSVDQLSQKINGLFTGIPAPKKVVMPPIIVEDLTQPPQTSYNYKPAVLKQLPWKLMRRQKTDEASLQSTIEWIKETDIRLPCHSYETISSFKSIYRCLPRDELFVVLEGMANRRCEGDDLWTAVENLERILVHYEDRQ